MARYILALLIPTLYALCVLPSQPREVCEVPSPGQRIVERVIDGDTLVLVGGERVRLLGVDTPETVHPNREPEPFGYEAKAFTTDLVLGKPVTLVFDREKTDHHGRTLAYVYIDGVCLNRALLYAGYARGQYQYPYGDDMKRKFSQAELTAQADNRGLWAN